MGKGRGFNNSDFKEAVDGLQVRYERLIFDNALNPSLLESFEDRVWHAKNSGRDPNRFLDDELKAFKELEAVTQEKERANSIREEARRRRLAGESFADKVLDEYRQRIEHYPVLDIHPDADPEISKLYGAMDLLDKRYWGTLESYLRKAFPRAGQIDRMSIEQRFWRFVATRKGRLPEELERYRRTLAAPSATKKEILRETQEAIKDVAFYLHDLLDVCEQALQQITPDDEVLKALEFIRGMISDFRIKDLKRR
ncbi:MAG: hypothetical protein KAH21_08145 [Spirochaetaceae bacterium]|nr:hypothetical protein [Spirochaetaceae bacterium]